MPASHRPHSPLAAVCIDGRQTQPQSSRVPIEDWGFLYGWGVFETIRLHKRRALFLDRHLSRMYHTALALRIDDDDFDDAWWSRHIARTITQSHLSNGAINLYWTRGQPPEFRSRRIICVRHGRKTMRRGLKLWVAPWRVEPTSAGFGVKTMAYFPNMFAISCAWHEGFDTALLLNNEDRVADAATSSVFVVKGTRLETAPESEGALAGVTRGLVLESARELGIPTAVREISWRRLLSADGVFLTSTLRGVQSVVRIETEPCTQTSSARQIIARLRRVYQRQIQSEITRTHPAF